MDPVTVLYRVFFRISVPRSPTSLHHVNVCAHHPNINIALDEPVICREGKPTAVRTNSNDFRLKPKSKGIVIRRGPRPKLGDMNEATSLVERPYL